MKPRPSPISYRLSFSRLACVLAAVSTSATLATAQNYRFTNLGTLGGITGSASAINRNGQIVGYSTTLTGATRAFSTSASGPMVDLGTLGTDSSANAINDAGTIVGATAVSGKFRAFTTRVGQQMTSLLPNNESFPLGINNSGQIVGVILENSTFTMVGSQAGGTGFKVLANDTLGLAIADSGVMLGVGSNRFLANSPLGLVWQVFVTTYTGNAQNLGTILGKFNSNIVFTQFSISNPTANAPLIMVGGYTNGVNGDRAVIFSSTDPVLRDMGTLGGSTAGAYGVNSAGTIVGTSTTATNAKRAFIRKAGGTMTDLNNFVVGASGYVLTSANAINELGQIVGEAQHTATGNTVGFLLTPLSESRLSNLSVRTTLAANQILTVGFTMQGGAKPVLARVAGPGLGALGVPGTMADPKLALFNGSTQVAANDNWGGEPATAAAFTALGAFAFPGATSLDAALLSTVEGGRSVQASGTTAGGVIVEIYDAGTGNSPRLTNLSALNRVGPGPEILTAGFVIAGETRKNLLIRAAGPSLTPLGVPTVLADPKLELFNASSVKIQENDNYAATLAATFTSVGAFNFIPGARDAAFVVTLAPGNYTVQVSGADGGSGNAIVEVYELP